MEIRVIRGNPAPRCRTQGFVPLENALGLGGWASARPMNSAISDDQYFRRTKAPSSQQPVAQLLDYHLIKSR